MRYSGLNEAEYNFYKKRAANNTPLKRLATPEEVAKAIIFLCSEKAARITGQILKVDGGKSLTSAGFAHWYGADLMNRRFEANSTSPIAYFTKKIKDKFLNPLDGLKPGSHEWINEVQKSNWATHLEDAHIKVTNSYTKLNPDEEKLAHYVNMHEEGGAENPIKAKRIS